MFIDRSPYASSHRCKNNVWISYGCKYLYMLTQSLHPHMRLRYFVCSAMKLDITWAALAGIDKAGFLDPDPIHICTTWMMFNCHHAIQNSLRSLLMHAEFITIFSEFHSKTSFLGRHLAIDSLCWFKATNMAQGQYLCMFTEPEWPHKGLHNVGVSKLA